MVLAVICGLLLMSIISIILTMGFFGALASSGSSKPIIPREGVLKMDLSTISIVEQATSEPDPIAVIQGQSVTPVSLWECVQALNAAAVDPAVKLLYMKVDNLNASVSTIEELRASIEKFRASGKAVIAYTENPGTLGYFLASAADKIYMTSAYGATPMITGIGTQMFFLKDILDRLGVNVQLIRHGKYKSAGEMFIKNTASPENLEQNQSMINSLWKTLASEIEAGRSLEEGSFAAMIDGLELGDAHDMLEKGLIDGILSKEDMRVKIATLSGKESFSDVKFIPFADYVKAAAPEPAKGKNKIAILYAEGDIVEGRMEDGQITGDGYSTLLSEIRNDKDIKAVVFRVSSPGGSVLASDKIKQEIDLLKAEKPVIASYGDYAASGGYWISAGCDKIFTDRTTITGSIGVFSMVPDMSKTASDLLHVGVVTVGSGKHSDMYSMMRPLDKEETAYMQASVEGIYERFVNTVAEGRGLEADFVDSIAQGRVWTGVQSIELGLTDATGTLEDAVEYAANVAGAGEDLSWQIVTYPKPATTMEKILSMVQGLSEDKDVFSGTPFEGVSKAFRGFGQDGAKVYARLPYEYIIK